MKGNAITTKQIYAIAVDDIADDLTSAIIHGEDTESVIAYQAVKNGLGRWAINPWIEKEQGFMTMFVRFAEPDLERVILRAFKSNEVAQAREKVEGDGVLDVHSPHLGLSSLDSAANRLWERERNSVPEERTIFHVSTADCGARLVLNGKTAAIILEHPDGDGDMIDEPFEYAAEVLQAKITDLPALGYLSIEGRHVHFHFSHLERPEAQYILVGAEPQGKGIGASLVIPMQFILSSLEHEVS